LHRQINVKVKKTASNISRNKLFSNTQRINMGSFREKEIIKIKTKKKSCITDSTTVTKGYFTP